MKCKNCSKSLQPEHSYCSYCGAKIIHKRLTFKNLWHDATEKYFNLDNTFLKTFKHLFNKPELVIDGYIGGTRKKYLNPISYFGIALMLSGLSLFLLKNIFINDIDLTALGTTQNPEVTKKILDSLTSVSSFIFTLYIPLLASVSWVCFHNKKYLFPEYIVTFIYTLSHYSIIIFPLNLIVLFFVPAKYLSFSLIGMIIMMLYSLYVVLKLNHHLKTWNKIGKSLTFITLFFIAYIAVSIFLNLAVVFFTDLTFKDFLPKQV